MFGYVVPCKGQIGEDCYEVFTSYYCGLCKAMGKQCSQASRLGLSYDITFLSLLLSSVSEEEPDIKAEPCMIHPFKKRKCVKNNKATDYGACMGVLLSYLKLLDDWQDEHSIKALGGMAVFVFGVIRARRKYPKEYKYIRDCLDELSALEKKNCTDIDRIADCFARILQKLFTPAFVEDNNTRRVLEWLGYNLGRWIYVLDAVNDLEKDYKSGSYNPLLIKDIEDITEHRKRTAENQEISLTFTLENIASSFELLKVYRNQELLYKIIHDSLRIKQKNILNIGEQ